MRVCVSVVCICPCSCGYVHMCAEDIDYTSASGVLLKLSSPYCLRRSLSLTLKLVSSAMAGWTASSENKDASIFPALALYTNAHIYTYATVISFYMGTKDPDSGPHACTAIAVAT